MASSMFDGVAESLHRMNEDRRRARERNFDETLKLAELAGKGYRIEHKPGKFGGLFGGGQTVITPPEPQQAPAGYQMFGGELHRDYNYVSDLDRRHKEAQIGAVQALTNRRASDSTRDREIRAMITSGKYSSGQSMDDETRKAYADQFGVPYQEEETPRQIFGMPFGTQKTLRFGQGALPSQPTRNSPGFGPPPNFNNSTQSSNIGERPVFGQQPRFGQPQPSLPNVEMPFDTTGRGPQFLNQQELTEQNRKSGYQSGYAPPPPSSGFGPSDPMPGDDDSKSDEDLIEEYNTTDDPERLAMLEEILLQRGVQFVQ